MSEFIAIFLLFRQFLIFDVENQTYKDYWRIYDANKDFQILIQYWLLCELYIHFIEIGFIAKLLKGYWWKIVYSMKDESIIM